MSLIQGDVHPQRQMVAELGKQPDVQTQLHTLHFIITVRGERIFP